MSTLSSTNQAAATITEADLRKMLSGGTKSDQLTAAAYTPLPSELLDLAVKARDADVQCVAAANPSCTHAHFKALLRASEVRVRVAALRSPTIPVMDIESAATSPEPLVRQAALSNPRIPASFLDKAARTNLPTDLIGAVGNPNARAAIVELCLDSRLSRVRRAAIASPAMTDSLRALIPWVEAGWTVAGARTALATGITDEPVETNTMPAIIMLSGSQITPERAYR